MKIDIEKYRDLGLKLTPQRIAILEFLSNNKTHPTAEDIFKGITKKYPTVSFATVYNTIEALKKRGLLREVQIDPGRRHFEENIEPHSHVICNKCGKIKDVNTNLACAESLTDELKGEFEIRFEEVNFFGVCKECLEKNKH